MRRFLLNPHTQRQPRAVAHLATHEDRANPGPAEQRAGLFIAALLLAVAALVLVGCNGEQTGAISGREVASPAELHTPPASQESIAMTENQPAKSSASEADPQACDADANQAGGCSAEFFASKTDEEWRAILTPEQYRIMRQAGTERPFTGKYWNTKTPGIYHCAACDQPLYHSDTKFDSGTGWPSFYAAVSDHAVSEHEDRSHGMRRVEIRCSQCSAHLGHVFDDGPPPTGQRHCLNSAALNHKPSNPQ